MLEVTNAGLLSLASLIIIIIVVITIIFIWRLAGDVLGGGMGWEMGLPAGWGWSVRNGYGDGVSLGDLLNARLRDNRNVTIYMCFAAYHSLHIQY